MYAAWWSLIPFFLGGNRTRYGVHARRFPGDEIDHQVTENIFSGGGGGGVRA